MADTATKGRATRAAKKQDAGDGITKTDRAALEEQGQIAAYDPIDHGGRAGGSAKGARLMDVPLALIQIEPGFNPRQEYDQDALNELAESIKMHGLVQPVILRPKPGVKAGAGFYLTGGHRRFKASQIAEQQTIPAIIRDGGDVLAAAVLDNSHRIDLNPVEEALVYQRAMTKQGLTSRGVAERFNIALRRVTERLRILEIPEGARPLIADGKIAMTAIAFYADVAAKGAPGLAEAMMAWHAERGHAPDAWDVKRDVLPQAKGVIDPYNVKAGSKVFKLTRPEVREAIEQLKKANEGYSGPGYNWRHGPGHLMLQVKDHFGSANEITVPLSLMEEGQKLDTVLGITFSGGRGNSALYVVLDGKWFQTALEEATLASVASLKKSKTASANASQRTTGKKRDDELSESELAERDAKRKENERKAREREHATQDNALLGPALLKTLSAVPLNVDTAKALCLLLLKPQQQYAMNHQNNVAALAGDGLRYVLPEFAHTRKVRGKDVPALLTDRAELEKRFWAWWNLAETPEEIIGRTLVAFAAAHYADGRQALSAEQLYDSVSVNPDAWKYVEKLVDKQVPARLRKRGAKQTSRPLSEVLADDDGDDGIAAKAAELSAAAAPTIVHVRAAGTTRGGEAAEAELCPLPEDPERNVRKVIYTDSRTAARVAVDRIVDLPEGM